MHEKAIGYPARRPESMKGKIETLLRHVKRDFPNGCIGFDCKDCPLLTSKDPVAVHLCKAIRATTTKLLD